MITSEKKRHKQIIALPLITALLGMLILLIMQLNMTLNDGYEKAYVREHIRRRFVRETSITILENKSLQ